MVAGIKELVVLAHKELRTDREPQMLSFLLAEILSDEHALIKQFPSFCLGSLCSYPARHKDQKVNCTYICINNEMNGNLCCGHFLCINYTYVHFCLCLL